MADMKSQGDPGTGRHPDMERIESTMRIRNLVSYVLYWNAEHDKTHGKGDEHHHGKEA